MTQYIPSESDIQRFWAKVDKSAGYSACWFWTAFRNAEGYGRFSMNCKGHNAHRVAWEVTYGKIPDGKCVCHSCDNPSCVNPNHLWLGTHGDNARDRNKKGRGYRAAGEKNPHSKLTWDDVRSIRKRYASGGVKQVQLCREYGVSSQLMSNIINGNRWKERK